MKVHKIPGLIYAYDRKEGVWRGQLDDGCEINAYHQEELLWVFEHLHYEFFEEHVFPQQVPPSKQFIEKLNEI